MNGKKLDGTAAAAVSFTGKTIILSSDIEITGGFAPIGASNRPFTRIFDGAGHCIRDLISIRRQLSGIIWLNRQR